MWWWEVNITFDYMRYLIDLTNPVIMWRGYKEGFLKPMKYYAVALVITVIVMQLIGY